MSRRTLAGLILLAWFGALGWLVQRQYGPGPGGAESAARWPVPPGSAFLAVRLGDRQIGLATATVDTLGDSLRVSELTTIDLPAVDTTPRLSGGAPTNTGFPRSSGKSSTSTAA